MVEPGAADPWERFRFFLGVWSGRGSGEPGTGTASRQYAFVLGDRFLHIRNRSVYPPQDRNPKGEVHEDEGFLSYDRGRKTFVLREFHVEGFVNQYVLERGDNSTFVFVTESIENVPAGWRARLTIRVEGDGAFRETFELAAPAKEFERYSEHAWTRATGA